MALSLRSHPSRVRELKRAMELLATYIDDVAPLPGA